MKHDNYAWVDELMHPVIAKTSTCYSCSKQCRTEVIYSGDTMPYEVPGIDEVHDCQVGCQDDPEHRSMLCYAGDSDLKNHTCAHCEHGKLMCYAVLKEEYTPQKSKEAKMTVQHALYRCKKPQNHRGRPSSKVVAYRAHCTCESFKLKESK